MTLALVRPDGTVRSTQEAPYRNVPAGHRVVTVTGFVPGVPLQPFPVVPPGATTVAAVYDPADLVPPRPRRMPPLAFFDLFTDAEEQAIATVALQSVDLFRWYNRATAAQEIDLDDEQTIGGLAALVGAGLLTGERRDAILAGEAP